MNTAAIDMTGHACCEHPLERHSFSGDSYLCSTCHRPRALHLHDAFIPGHPKSYLSFDPKARYRGPHPAFWRPGTGRRSILPTHEEPPVNDRQRWWARSQMEHEAETMSRLIQRIINRPQPAGITPPEGTRDTRTTTDFTASNGKQGTSKAPALGTPSVTTALGPRYPATTQAPARPGRNAQPATAVGLMPPE